MDRAAGWHEDASGLRRKTRGSRQNEEGAIAPHAPSLSLFTFQPWLASGHAGGALHRNAELDVCEGVWWEAGLAASSRVSDRAHAAKLLRRQDRLAGAAGRRGDGASDGRRHGIRGRGGCARPSCFLLCTCTRALLAWLRSTRVCPRRWRDRPSCSLGAGHVTPRVEPGGFHSGRKIEKRRVPSLLNAFFDVLRLAASDGAGSVHALNARRSVARQPDSFTSGF